MTPCWTPRHFAALILYMWVALLHAGQSLAAAPSIPSEELRLSNGLQVILHRDASLPLVAVNVWYHVGPANEPSGRSGFAHLFEHLMFEGSLHVGERFDELLEAAGATNSNGTTSWDRTNYFQTVPREYLELVLWIESDRMGFLLDAIDKEALDTQREVVLNERRQTYENSPYGPSTLALLDTLFPDGHPYHGAIIGSTADLRAATLDHVRGFYEEYYAPSNATLVLAGDFDPEVARRWVAQYFGDLRDRPRPPALSAVTVPALAGAQRVTVEEPVQLSQVAFGWACPPAYSKADPALQVATELLATGRTSRLYRELVVEARVATDVSAWFDANALASVAVVSATAAEGIPPARVEQALAASLARLGQEGPSAIEVARAKRRLLLELNEDLQRLDGPGGESGRAGLLQRFNHYLGRPNAITEWHARLDSVTSADVQAVVAELLGPQRRATVVTIPKQGNDNG